MAPDGLLLALACALALGAATADSMLFRDSSTAFVHHTDFSAEPISFAPDTFQYVQYTRDLSSLDALHAANPQTFNAPLVELLRRIYAAPSLLSADQVQAGIANAGHERIERFVSKLVAGKPVTVVVLGGSISFGHGVKTFENTWVNRLFRWIEHTFPNEKHQLINHAIPATTSSFATPCAHSMINEDTDLVVLEYTINDSADDAGRAILAAHAGHLTCSSDMDSPARHLLERLTRNILMLPSKPALLYVHTWAGNRPDVAYYGGVEDRYTTIMSYYGVPTLSMRNALHDLVERSAGVKGHIWRDDKDFHPSAVGTKFLADLVIGYLADRAAASAWRLHGRQHTAPQLQYADAQLWELPPPIFAGNKASYSTECILDERVQRYAINAQGFNWVNEGHVNDPKWGWVATLPGAQLAIKVPLSNVSHNGADILVGIGFLLSYAHMGVAQVGCLAGCVCQLQEYSTYIKHSGWSMTYWRFLEAKVVPGSQECVVGVIVSPKTHSDGHKIKVSSVMVSGELGMKHASNAFIEGGIINAPGGAHAVAHRRAMAEVDLEGLSVSARASQRLNATRLALNATELFPNARR